jgi:predicted amidohydrolase
MPHYDLLISGGHVVTLDPEIGDLPQGDVLIRNGRITPVGADLAPRAPGTRVLDTGGRLVIPGPVDTHRMSRVWRHGASRLAGVQPGQQLPLQLCHSGSDPTRSSVRVAMSPSLLAVSTLAVEICTYIA